jgi:guanylate kinase
MSTDLGVLLIGGSSGVGKSTFVAELLRIAPDRFERMPALTSREPRGSDDKEYTFTSRAAIENLYANGLLVNIDEVYGELYAVRESDIHRAHRAGRIPVKEVHIDNFAAFETAFPNTLTLVLINEPKINRARDRVIHDAMHASDIWSIAERAHLIINLDHFDSPDQAARHVLVIHDAAGHNRDIQCSDPRTIDRTNEIAYSTVANQFVDDHRITTRDFHEASVAALREAIGRISSGARVLEVGSGRGWLSSNVDLGRFELLQQESASGMLRYLPSTGSTIHCPARALPLDTGSCDAVLGSLVDRPDSRQPDDWVGLWR